MPIHLIGTTAGDAPFNRVFFNTTLGEIIGNGESRKVTLFLVDGVTLDVVSVESLNDQYATVKAHNANKEPSETSLLLIPYGTIYRVEISGPENDEDRVGFHFSAREKRGTPPRRSR
jgi:hypothetical protein